MLLLLSVSRYYGAIPVLIGLLRSELVLIPGKTRECPGAGLDRDLEFSL